METADLSQEQMDVQEFENGDFLSQNAGVFKGVNPQYSKPFPWYFHGNGFYTFEKGFYDAGVPTQKEMQIYWEFTCLRSL